LNSKASAAPWAWPLAKTKALNGQAGAETGALAEAPAWPLGKMGLVKTLGATDPKNTPRDFLDQK
jgi:hypothetical protein